MTCELTKRIIEALESRLEATDAAETGGSMGQPPVEDLR